MKPYIIGETAYNHEGDYDYLINMIDDIRDMRLDAVKFHLLLNADSYLTKKHPIKDMIKKWMFDSKEWKDIINHSLNSGLEVVALCDDIDSLKFINDHFPELSFVEIHATGINDLILLDEASRFRNTVILGIGGCSLEEINFAVNYLRNNGKDEILLMYGFQSYPTKLENINMAKISLIKDLLKVKVGYADHTAYDDERNVDMSVMGAAMGMPILEKHYTPDFGVERIDYHSAVGKEIMMKIKEKMTMYLEAYGNGSLEMSDPELKYGNTGPMKKAIVAKKDIKKGETLTIENLCFKRTEGETYIKQNQFMSLLGSTAIADIVEDVIIDYSNVEYKFKEPDLSVVTGGIKR